MNGMNNVYYNGKFLKGDFVFNCRKMFQLFLMCVCEIWMSYHAALVMLNIVVFRLSHL